MVAQAAEAAEDFARERPESAPLTTESPPSSKSQSQTASASQRAGDHDATRAAAPPRESPPKRNAFAELMAPKPKAPISQAPQSMANKASKTIRGVWRGALIEYIEHPERFPDQVLRVTANTVLVKDAFPKATVHLLLLPRSPAHYLLHPHTAFADAAFLAMMRDEAAEAAKLAAAELARRLGSFSATHRARSEAMDRGVPFDELPAGRYYSRDIRVGTHAHPSMAHLHVHIISRDLHSERAKHKKHYNSFATPFFVPLADYPLGEDDVRRETGFQNGNLRKDLVCWRCGMAFGNRFAELKRHLEDEFGGWRAV